MQELEIVRSQDHSSRAKNVRRKQAFEIFINRESSQFERVEKETALLHDVTIDSKMKRVLHRVNSASERERRESEKETRDRARARTVRRTMTIRSTTIRTRIEMRTARND